MGMMIVQQQHALQGCLHNRPCSLYKQHHRRPVAVKSASGTASGVPTAILGIPPELRAQGGVDPSTQPEDSRQGYSQFLKLNFLGVNTLHPGLRLLCLDPPVITVDNFVPAEVCQALMTASEASKMMAVSRIGGGDPNAPANIRTSRTLALTKEVLTRVPGVKPALEQLLSAAAQLIQVENAALQKALFTKPTNVGQLVPELPQVAHYQPGQHFLAHEDAFPAQIAGQKGFQRRATLLVYLNDVEQGGSTRFERLGFEVQPKQGKALLFFPAFKAGRPDARTLHTAVDAVSEKWIFQLWLTSGLPAPKGQPAGQPGQSSKGKTKRK